MAVLSFSAKTVTKEQFEEFNKAVHEDYKVGNPTETSGTIQDHAATVDYKYDEEDQVINFNIEKVHRGFFEKVDPEQVKNQLLNFLNDVTSGDSIEEKVEVEPEEVEEIPEEKEVLETPEIQPPVEIPVKSEPTPVEISTETTNPSDSTSTSEVKPFTPKV